MKSAKMCILTLHSFFIHLTNSYRVLGMGDKRASSLPSESLQYNKEIQAYF